MLNRALAAAVIATLIVALVGACQSTAPTVSIPLPHVVARVETPDGFAGVARKDFRLSLILGDGRTASEVSSGEDHPHEATVHLATYGGETGTAMNSYVWGNAPPRAVRVQLSLGGVGGQVVDGLYVVALPDKEVRPDALRWSFLDAGGRAVEEGTGIT